MRLAEGHRDMVCIPRGLFDRLMAAGGRLESGQIANMNTYLLPRETCLHVRILGEGRTLCGRRWMPGGWQFCSRGSFGEHAPFGTYEGAPDVCRSCAKSPALKLTNEAEAARVAALTGRRKAA
jgi:hypothetical protein